MSTRATIASIMAVKDAFVCDTAADIVGIALFAVVDVVAGSIFGVLDQSLQ